MHHQNHRRDPIHHQDGFSLIELMIVVLIIAILVTLAVPAFLGARNNASDRSVQANVRTALSAAKIHYTKTQAYTESTSTLTGIEPALTWSTVALGSGASTTTVYVDVVDTPQVGQTIVLGARNADGRCYYLRDVASGSSAGTYYAEDTDGTCGAPSAASITASSWS